MLGTVRTGAEPALVYRIAPKSMGGPSPMAPPRSIPIRSARSLRRACTSVGCGLALGVITRLEDRIAGASGTLANLGAVWLALAFVVGGRGYSKANAALLGAGTLLSALVGYYGVMHFAEGQANGNYLVTVAWVWILPAVIGGAATAVAGWYWRVGGKRARSWSAAALAAAMCGESAALLTRHPTGLKLGILFAELFAGVMLPCVLLRRGSERASAYAMLGLLAGFAVVAYLGLVVVLRGLGPT